MYVIKRSGKKELYDSEKVKAVIYKALDAAKAKGEALEIVDFCKSLEDAEEKNVEEIQDAVEDFLMQNPSTRKAAKAFIKYREKHKEARLIYDKLKYINKYANSNDTGTNLSNTDDNANSSKKNIANLEGELYKDTNRIIQRQWMKEMLSEINSKYRDQYIKDLENHIFYQHDETGGLKPYCSAYTMYPLLVDGTNNIDGTRNFAPKHLGSFVGQFQNLVFLLSSLKKGAGAYGEFFNFFSYFCEKEWGEDYWQKADTIVTSDACKEKRTIGSTIDQYFQSVTHYINQPAANRGSQSPLN